MTAQVAPGAIPLERPEPLIRVDDIAWVAFEKPDLELMERFLVDFGMTVAARDGDTLYMRGSGPAHHLYVARRGPASRFLGAAFRAASRADLETISAAPGASPVRPLDAPGGGEGVTLTDPNGFRVDVVHGVEELSALPRRHQAPPQNTPDSKNRVNLPVRPELRPAHVVRLGHLVLETPRFEDTARWYMRHLGLIPSDVQCLEDGTPNLAFLRCDRGRRPADHHTVVVFGGIAAAYRHSAYEVIDLDDVGIGQQVLKERGWVHLWGIGRHILGSQIFDYWRDPYGDEVEHFADGDVFDAAHPTAYHPFDPATLWMWGDDLPADFSPRPTPRTLLSVAWRLARGDLSATRLRLLKRAAERPARPWLAPGKRPPRD